MATRLCWLPGAAVRRLGLAVVLCGVATWAWGHAPGAPSKWCIAHAESIMARYPDPDSIPHRPWCYTQGYILRGFERLFDLAGDQRFFDYLRRFVDQHVDERGNIRGFSGEHLDDMLAGTAILAVYQRTGELKYRLAAERIRNAFREYPRNADGGFWHAGRRFSQRSHEMWIDGVFMGQMFLLRYGELVDDREACYDEAAKQIVVFASHALRPGTGLYVHGYDEDRNAGWADAKTGLSSEVWSEGLGWYGLVLVEALRVLPIDHPRRAEILQITRDLCEGLARFQDAQTGLWYQVVDKPTQAGNWTESSGTGMFVYTLQRAIDLGLIDRGRYGPVATKGYAGLLTKVSLSPSHGLVDIRDACDGLGVQKSYEDYVRYPRRINAKETQGSFLWASIEMELPKDVLFPDLLGTWRGNTEIFGPFKTGTFPSKEPEDHQDVVLHIGPTGRVVGRIGQAYFRDATVRRNRGALLAQLNLFTDYLVEGVMSGPVNPRDNGLPRRFTLPFNLKEGIVSGTIMLPPKTPLCRPLRLERAMEIRPRAVVAEGGVQASFGDLRQHSTTLKR